MERLGTLVPNRARLQGDAGKAKAKAKAKANRLSRPAHPIGRIRHITSGYPLRPRPTTTLHTTTSMRKASRRSPIPGPFATLLVAYASTSAH